jgi:hypothetical protein
MCNLFVLLICYVIWGVKSYNLTFRANITHHHASYIPLLSTSLNVDPKGYIERLIKSIDFPIHRMVLQIGSNCFVLETEP